MSHKSEAGQLFGIIKGAVNGKLYSEVPLIAAPSEYPKFFPANPSLQVFGETIKNVLDYQDIDRFQHDKLPWSSEKVNINKLFRSWLLLQMIIQNL